MIDVQVGSFKIPDFDVEAANKRLQAVQARETYRIIQNLYSEEEAEAACQALLDKWPSVYMRALANDYIHNRSLLEAAETFFKKESKYE